MGHGVLSFYGRWAYVHSADMDEFLIPATPGQTITTMLSAGCMSERPECSVVPGRAIFPHQEDPPTLSEPDLWAQPGPIPLLHYRYFSPNGAQVVIPR